MIHEKIEHHIVPRRYVGEPNRLRLKGERNEWPTAFVIDG